MLDVQKWRIICRKFELDPELTDTRYFIPTSDPGTLRALSMELKQFLVIDLTNKKTVKNSMGDPLFDIPYIFYIRVTIRLGRLGRDRESS